jgi:hypothetical protein
MVALARRRDQQRVLEALARRDGQQHARMRRHRHRRTTGRPDHEHCLWRWWTSVSHRASRWTAALRVHHPPTALLPDGADADVGGVGSNQTQDTGTETNSSTANQQTHDAGSGANTTPVYDEAGNCWMNTTPVYDEAGNCWMLPVGWIANGTGGWISPDGAHWGARERPPLRIAGDAWTRRRSREHREHRSRLRDERTADPPPGRRQTNATSSKHLKKRRRSARNGIPHDTG